MANQPGMFLNLTFLDSYFSRHFKSGDTLFALDNSRKGSFIPSTENYFGGFHAKFVMLDSGCNSHLLAIEDGGLPALYVLFPPTQYRYIHNICVLLLF